MERPLHYDRDRSLEQPLPPKDLPFGRLPSLEIAQNLLVVNNSNPNIEPFRSGSGAPAVDEFSALNALIHDRSTRWSKKARAIKFDIEFKAIEQERRRVAKELHDETLPLLARLIRAVQSDTSVHTSASEEAVAKESLSALINELHATVSAFRDLLGELHPVDLEELGLVPALSNLCKRYGRFSGRSIVFMEEDDECKLSEFQQLCIYRAIQIVLRLFDASENDILLVNHKRDCGRSVITLQCVDKRVASQDWLSEEMPECDAFRTWCGMAGAEVQLGSGTLRDFACDVVISASEMQSRRENTLTLIGQLSRIRLKELESILALAQDEWTELINRDCALFRNLAIEVERKRITEQINNSILQHFTTIMALAGDFDQPMRSSISERMQCIVSGVNGVISELHPTLLAQTGFVPSIRTLVDRFRRSSLIETTIVSNLLSENIDISNDAKFAIYRVTQEALNNIEKHSAATRAIVLLKHEANTLTISIEDNGKGLQAKTSTQSRGLKYIRERASDIGATVAWKQSQSFASGTQVTISLKCENISLDTTAS